MHSTTVAVDLAKDVIEVAVAGPEGRVGRRERLGREGFSKFLALQLPSRIVMESCGGAHYWARKARANGHSVAILPAQYVRAYRRRNKTDRADCSALLEAIKSPDIKPVAVKTQLHQAIQGLHRLRSRWVASRTGRINTLRGLLHEFGITMPRGAVTALKQLPTCIDRPEVPDALRPMLQEVFSEIRDEGKTLTRLQRWALDLKSRTNHNKAAVGLANKMARIAWATWFHGRQFDGNYAAG